MTLEGSYEKEGGSLERESHLDPHFGKGARGTTADFAVREVWRAEFKHNHFSGMATGQNATITFLPSSSRDQGSTIKSLIQSTKV